MDVILMNGSPRKSGSCEYIIQFIKSILDREGISHETIDVKSTNIAYCTGCGACEKTGWCIIKDDGVDMHKKFDMSKATIIVTPVYFNSMPAQMKTVIDRMQAIYSSKYVLKKPTIDREKARFGALIALGGSAEYENQFTGVRLIADMFFKVINTKWIAQLLLSGTDFAHARDRDADLDKIEGIVIGMLEEIREKS